MVVIGGAILGIGTASSSVWAASVDGTEILGIIVNKRTGITVGQTSSSFAISSSLRPRVLSSKTGIRLLLSLITYIVVVKVMDAVIVGLDETKSVLIISSKSQEIGKAIIHELGLGLTIMYGRGGFSGEEREILYVISERLQLADLKELIYREDPNAFIAIENIHEVANGNHSRLNTSPVEKFSPLIKRKH